MGTEARASLFRVSGSSFRVLTRDSKRETALKLIAQQSYLRPESPSSLTSQPTHFYIQVRSEQVDERLGSIRSKFSRGVLYVPGEICSNRL